jgi:hypothetical protein
MRRSLVALGSSLLAAVASLPAQETADGRGSQFLDPLLDHLVGDWHVTRRFGSGRTAQNTVHAEWVLNHQFLELHYLDVATPPKYEAMVFIGYDNTQKRYVCHWIDVFGGGFSGLAEGTSDEAGRAIEFVFNYPAGKFTNRFTYDPATQSWTSLMRQEAKGEWKLFAEDKFTVAARK